MTASRRDMARRRVRELLSRGLVLDLVGEFGRDIAGRRLAARIANHAGEHVLVRINSSGGVVHDAFDIFDALRKYPASVTTVAMARCASAAAIVLAAGDRRLALTRSRILVHATAADLNSQGIRFTAAVAESYARRLRHLDRKMIDIFVDRTRPSALRSWNLRNFWTDAVESSTEAELPHHLAFAAGLLTGYASRDGGELMR